MKLGELRDAIAQVLDSDTAMIPLREDAEVVVEGDDAWLRAEVVAATFLRGRWTLLIRTAEPGDVMWMDSGNSSNEKGDAHEPVWR